MRRTILPATAIAALLASMPLLAEEAPGKEVFIAQKCDQCHSVASAAIQHTSKVEKLVGPDLDGIGDRHDAEWMTKLVKREVEGASGKKHLKPFKGTDEELQAIIAWLATLKDEEGP